MGWTVPWVSSLGSDFNFDFDVSQSEEASAALVREIGGGPIVDIAVDCGTELTGYLTEAPALSAFALEDGIVYFTYSTFARGTEVLVGFYPLLDRTPNGRNEGDDEMWIRRHDEYEQDGPAQRDMGLV
jgi:predicted dithiol-disulfide oxidoreductase (DUF899 family)